METPFAKADVRSEVRLAAAFGSTAVKKSYKPFLLQPRRYETTAATLLSAGNRTPHYIGCSPWTEVPESDKAARARSRNRRLQAIQALPARLAGASEANARGSTRQLYPAG